MTFFSHSALLSARLLGCAALLLSGSCTEQQRARPVVGVVLASSGPADFIGKPERDVLQKLEADYRRSRDADPGFDLRFLDSRGDPRQAETLYRTLAADSAVVAVIGPSTSGEAIALAELSDELRLPVLALGASRQIVLDPQERTRRWVFKFAQNDNLAAEALVRAMVQQHHRRVALLFSNDGFGRSGATEFRNAVSRAESMRLVADAAYEARLTQAGPVVAALPPDLDAVLVWGTAPGPGLIVQALRRTRSAVPIYLSHGNASPDFIGSLGPAAEGIVIMGSRVLLGDNELNPSREADRVVKQYRTFWSASFAGAPSHFAGHARDAYEALVIVFQQQPNADREQVRQGLEGLNNFVGVTGTFSFGPADHAGLSIDAFQTYRIMDGAFVPFRPSR